MAGVPLDEKGYFAGRFLDQLSPYALLVGLMTVAMFTMHGAIYLGLKTEGELHARLERWMWRGFGFFLTLFLIRRCGRSSWSRGRRRTSARPAGPGWSVANVLAIANIPRALVRGRPADAFVSSSCSIAAFVFFRVGPVPEPGHVHRPGTA